MTKEMERRVLLTTCLDGWLDVAKQNRMRREAQSVEQAEEVSRLAFQQAEATLSATQQELDDILLRHQELESKLTAAEARAIALERDLDSKTAQLDAAREMQTELETLVKHKDFELNMQMNHARTLQNDMTAQDAQISRRNNEINRLQAELDKHVAHIQERDEQITKLELDAHTKKMGFLAVKRECDTKTASLESQDQILAEKDAQLDRYRDIVEKLEEEIARLKTAPDDRVARDAVQQSLLSAVQTRLNQLERQLGQAQEDLFISTLHGDDIRGKPLVKELMFTRKELDALAKQLQNTEKAAVQHHISTQHALSQAKEDLQLLSELKFQNQASHVKVQELERENAALLSHAEALDVAHEELLVDIAVLSSSPFGQKMIRRDWDWKKAAAAYRLVTSLGAKIKTKTIYAKPILDALHRNMRKTLRADILLVHNVRLDAGALKAFDMLSSKGPVTTLFWGAGPQVDPLRSDLMFWFLSQPWGAESAAHAHHLGAYCDGERYRLVVLKAAVSQRELGTKQYERVSFDPFTCVPMAIITYKTTVTPTGTSVAHPLSYLRYATDWDEETTAKSLERISQTMGTHGVNLTMAMATLQTPFVRTVARDTWERCKSKALENAAAREQGVEEQRSIDAWGFADGGTGSGRASRRNPTAWKGDYSYIKRTGILSVLQCSTGGADPIMV